MVRWLLKMIGVVLMSWVGTVPVLAASTTSRGATTAEFEFSREPIALPQAHREALERRKKRIVVQQDVFWVMRNYAKLFPGDEATYERFEDAVFSYVDEPGSQIDAIWWDNGGNAPSPVYPSKVLPPVEFPLVKQWLSQGIDWTAKLVEATRRRNLEVFWSHRFSEVDRWADGTQAKEKLVPLKEAHPEWTTPASYWWQGMWNLESAGLRAHKVEVLRELATQYDLDGIQIDFARHIPCLPVGRQWELRHHVTAFLRSVRVMLLEVAAARGRPFFLAARIPETLEGCRIDGFDVQAWSEQNLVDILTLGTRTMDVHVEAFRKIVGTTIQLQPCFDDHHTTDGYRYASIEYLRGVFANHWQRGADSVMTFNWAVAKPELARAIGGEVAPLTHQIGFKELGDLRTLAQKNKIYAVERRGGYPWADGYLNRNDTAPLPFLFSQDELKQSFILTISDPSQVGTELSVVALIFNADEADEFNFRLNGANVAMTTRIHDAKDPQIFSPKPQKISGSDGKYPIDPLQRLLRIEGRVSPKLWRQGPNVIEVSWRNDGVGSDKRFPQLEKIEAHLSYRSAESAK